MASARLRVFYFRVVVHVLCAWPVLGGSALAPPHLNILQCLSPFVFALACVVAGAAVCLLVCSALGRRHLQSRPCSFCSFLCRRPALSIGFFRLRVFFL